MKSGKFVLLAVAAWELVLTPFPSVFAQTWTQTSAPSNRWWSVASSADGTKLVAVSSLKIYTSTNSGITWKSNNIPSLQWEAVASSADGSKLVAVAWKGGPIYTSTNSGSTWTPTSAPNNYWASVASSADGAKLAAAATDAGDKRIYVSTNGGVTWAMTTAPNKYWFSIASSADGAKLTATMRGLIYNSTNFGATWLPSVTSSNSNWTPGNSAAMSADGNKQVVIAGGGSGIYISTNSGSGWLLSSLPTNLNWSSVASSADGTRLIAAAGNGRIYTSNNSGTTWMSNSVPSQPWRSVACSADGLRLVAASANDSSGEIWTARSASLPAVNCTPPANGNFKVSSIVPSTNCVVEHSLSLTNGTWVVVTNVPFLNLTNLCYEISLPLEAGSDFFRLKTP